jgi:hypothetical protein
MRAATSLKWRCYQKVERFFILGCQRTGTTLLRLILEAHPDIFCYDEMKGYAVLQDPAAETHSTARLVGFKLPRWTEQLTRPVLSDEGVEGFCSNFYRGEKILFLQRDVRDTIVSMFKLKVGRSTWCENWVPRIIKAKIASEEAFRTRYAAELSIIDDSNAKLVGLAALYWKFKSEAINQYCEAGLPVLPVSYEALVQNPRPVLESVCQHLGIPFHNNLMRHHEFPHTELFANGLTVGNSDPKLPIKTASVGQWEHFLSPEELRVIERVVGESAVSAPWMGPSVRATTVPISAPASAGA